jgi:NAD(P)-dependent dehydrogenase (short-subunit alcohol dehydrogenase family)
MTDLPIRKLLDLSGKSALVTGAGRGIGAAIARRFAEAGAAVVVNYRASAAGAEALAQEIRDAGGRATAKQADVTSRAQIEHLMAATVSAHGGLDVLINNAGIYPVSSLVEMSEEEWDAVVDANLKSVHLCTQAAAARMIERGEGGAIVNIASIEGHATAPMHAHYDASKAGVIMHTRAAAQELGPHGIRVNAVSPGLIHAEGLEQHWPEGVARWLAAAPLGRVGRAVEVADACLFLTSPAATWITGAVLPVDGGVLARPAF